MDWQRLSKTVEIPGITFAEGLAHRDGMNRELGKAMESLGQIYGGLTLSETRDDNGNPTFTLSAKDYEVCMVCRYGQDRSFGKSGARNFLSYSIHSVARLHLEVKAASTSRRLTLFFGFGGALTGLLLVGAAMFGVFGWHLHFPEPFVAAAVLSGAWLGKKAGTAVGDRIEYAAAAKLEAMGAPDELQQTWTALELAVNTVFRKYEGAASDT